MPDRKIVLRRIGWLHHAFLWLAVIALALSGWYSFEATYYQAEYEQAFERLETERAFSGQQDERELASGVTGTSATGEQAPRVLADLVGRLEIARVDLQVMVLKRADAASLRRGAGWIARTAAPGQPGNMGIAGHRDTHFRPLERVRKGDNVMLTTVRGKRSRYRVEWIAIVSPSHVEVLDPTPRPALTLVTCYPFDYVGRAPRRLIVRAVRVAEGQGG